MAFEFPNLRVLAYVNHFTLWHFRGLQDALDDVSRSNFFGVASGMVQEGDMIVVSGRDGGRILLVSRVDAQNQLVVTSPLS